MAARTFGDSIQARSVAWVDYMKGFCIILVVMMHSTLGVEAAMGARGFLSDVVEFAAPFRIPAFFLAAGLFLGRTIDKPWPDYLDRKVGHFAYFYLLWLVINCVLKFAAAGPVTLGREIAMGLVEPFGTLWFIYVLPFFFVATKLLKRWPLATLGLAAALQIAPIHTGWYAIDQFAAYWVYFLSGYLFCERAFALANWAHDNPLRAGLILLLWFCASLAVTFGRPGGFNLAEAPLVSLALGFVGAASVILASSLLARNRSLGFIAYSGKRSLPIYLAFFVPMALTRTALLKVYPAVDVTLASALVTAAAVVGPLVGYWIVSYTPLRYLFQRPALLVRRQGAASLAAQ